MATAKAVKYHKMMLLRQKAIRAARKDFWAYNKLESPKFFKESRWHLKLMSWLLQALYQRRLTRETFIAACKKICPKWFIQTEQYHEMIDRLQPNFVYTRLIMNEPPRIGKSRTLVNFTKWCLGDNVENRIMTCSYNDSMAQSFSRYTRDGIMVTKTYPYETIYNDIFPNSIVQQGNASYKEWALEGQFFNYKGAGIGGSITGKGANCFPSGTLVQTEIGSVDIETLCNMQYKPLVLSFDHSTGKLVYRKIIASRRLVTNELIKIKTSCGRSITSTLEHRFFGGERGYREIGLFEQGDNLFSFKQTVCCLPKRKGWARSILQRLLPHNEENSSGSQVFKLLDGLRAFTIRTRKKYKERLQGLLLLQHLQPITSCSEKFKKVSLWECDEKIGQVLFKGMSEKSESKEVDTDKMQRVQRGISTYIKSCDVLQSDLCGFGTLQTDDRKEQFTLQRWNKLFQMVQRNEKSYFRTGLQSLCRMWSGEKACCPSHRRKTTEQCSREPNSSVFDLSPESSQIYTDSISSTERISCNEVAVYDIQVEGTSNFFANEILVHNCLIVDDPVKDAEEALNENRLDTIWTWYTGTFLSRLETEKGTGKNDIQIVNMTRWAAGDICGRILGDDRNKGPEADEWFVFTLEARYGDNMLCPELLDKKQYDSLKKNVLSEIFFANYHQQPIDLQGRLYKQFKTYTDIPRDENGKSLFEKIIAYGDTADEGDDYLAVGVAGVYNGELYMLDVYYTKDGMEITEPQTAYVLNKNDVSYALIESNNGGRGFARAVDRITWEQYRTRWTTIKWFHQSKNKKARILTGSNYVQEHIYFPVNWADRWPEYYEAMTKYQKEGKNKNDDAPDMTTGLGEMLDKNMNVGVVDVRL